MTARNWIASVRSESPSRRAKKRREVEMLPPACPNCGAELQESEVALCLCGHCGVRVCEGTV